MNRGPLFSFVVTGWMLLLGNLSSYAQKQYNMWYFGNKAGINFNTNPPSALTDGRIYAMEGSSGICDSAGNLLFYTSGDTFYNRKHEVMLNGATSNWRSPVQGPIVIPAPGMKDMYFSFQTPAISAPASDTLIRCSVINMAGDGGYGMVMIKEALTALPGGWERIAITRHANGKDYWIASVINKSSAFSDRFSCIRTKNGTLENQVVRQTIVTYYQDPYNIKFSPDGNIFLGPRFWDAGNKHFSLYRFNRQTGGLSDLVKVPFVSGSTLFYAEFSASSRYLYLTKLFSSGFQLVQYDLSDWDSAAIANSAKVIRDSLPYPAGMQLGPDKKIYFFYNGKKFLGIIQQPDQPGAFCQYEDSALYLGGRLNLAGVPYYPTYDLNPPILDLGPDTIICEGDSVKLYNQASATGKVLWSTGDTSAEITVNKTGVYWARISNDTDTISDTVKVFVNKKFKVYLGNDTAFCGQFTHLLHAGQGAKKYTWSTGDSGVSITVNDSGIYSVVVKDSNSCPAGDTVRIGNIRHPQLSVHIDSGTCRQVFLSASPRQHGISYSWSTGDTGLVTRTSVKGKYYLISSHSFCSFRDSIEIKKLPDSAHVDLGPDTELCTDKWLQAQGAGSYLWNTGSSLPGILVTDPGTYWLRVTLNGCEATDTIQLLPCRDMVFYIPNAFTPEGDNPVFGLKGNNITDVKMQVYNRWGEKLFESEGLSPRWDGTYMGIPCSAGVYVCLFEISGYRKGKPSTKSLAVTFSLIR